jgi:hypothetical protein
MLRIVLPFTTLPGLAPTRLLTRPVALPTITAVDLVFIKVVFVIDVDVAAVVPIAVPPGATDPGTECKSRRAPRQPHPWVVAWIGVRVIGICGRRSSVHHLRIIGGNVNYVGLSRLYDNDLLAAFYRFGLDGLLRTCFQVPRALSLAAHPLNCAHHVGLLREKGVTEIGRPLDIAR